MHHEINADTPDYDRIYDSARHLLHIDDLSFANIEFPVDPAREPAGYPIFNGTVEYLEAAVRAGFDLKGDEIHRAGDDHVHRLPAGMGALLSKNGIERSLEGLASCRSSPPQLR